MLDLVLVLVLVLVVMLVLVPMVNLVLLLVLVKVILPGGNPRASISTSASTGYTFAKPYESRRRRTIGEN